MGTVFLFLMLCVPAALAALLGWRWWKECERLKRKPQISLIVFPMFVLIATPALVIAGSVEEVPPDAVGTVQDYTSIKVAFYFLAINLLCGSVLGWLASCMESETQPPAALRVMTAQLVGGIAYTLLAAASYLLTYWIGLLRIASNTP